MQRLVVAVAISCLLGAGTACCGTLSLEETKQQLSYAQSLRGADVYFINWTNISSRGNSLAQKIAAVRESPDDVLAIHSEYDAAAVLWLLQNSPSESPERSEPDVVSLVVEFEFNDGRKQIFVTDDTHVWTSDGKYVGGLSPKLKAKFGFNDLFAD